MTVGHVQILLTMGSQGSGDAWKDLEWGVRTGGDIMQKVYGASLYDLFPKVDGLEDTFCRAMWALDHSGKSPLGWVMTYCKFLLHMLVKNQSAHAKTLSMHHRCACCHSCLSPGGEAVAHVICCRSWSMSRLEHNIVHYRTFSTQGLGPAR